METVAFTGLIKIEFPGHDMLLCDGGFVKWGSDTYRAKDSMFGSIGGVEALNEGVGEEVPAFELKLLPPGETDIADLSQPGFQTARAQFWIGEYDPETGLLDGTPDRQFDGQVDQTIITIGRETRELALTVVSNTKRLLERNIGNSLNPVWHKSIWPGETGHDNATGLGRAVAWGTTAPPMAVASSPATVPDGSWWNPTGF